jgi:hypothetical protein
MIIIPDPIVKRYFYGIRGLSGSLRNRGQNEINSGMKIETQPNPEVLKKRLGLRAPIVGFYDAPDPGLFKPLVEPKIRDCVFCFYEDWKSSRTLHITRENYGCGGAGRWMWGIQTRSRKDFIKFLAEEEGLKASPKLMEKWIDSAKTYRATHAHLFIGPLREEAWAYARTVTFFVNPDQLSALVIGAQYHSSPEDPTPVVAPFGSGCSQFQPFRDLQIAQASIGATDIAMRPHLPPDILSLTVTKSMFRRLCSLDERSFLFKPFLDRLREARGQTI